MNKGLFGWPEPQYPSHVTLWHEAATVKHGPTLGVVIDTAQLHNGYTQQNSAAGGEGDCTEQTFLLRAGRYSLVILGLHTSDSGKLDVYLDGNIIARGLDWYAAVTARNIFKVKTFHCNRSGVHTLQLRVNGKNTSSTGFEIRLTNYVIKAVSG